MVTIDPSPKTIELPNEIRGSRELRDNGKIRRRNKRGNVSARETRPKKSKGHARPIAIKLEHPRLKNTKQEN